MATYAFADVHGHAAPLDRLLNRVSPGVDDAVFMLGDMVDRGPSPVTVLKICRSIEGATILRGNHEELMLDFLQNPLDDMAMINWTINGGNVTIAEICALGQQERFDLEEWIASLPLYSYANVGGRLFAFVHAGIRSDLIPPHATWDEHALVEMLSAQDPEDLVWIREDFWGLPTGMVNDRGEGPIVIAGHTPTPYLAQMADRPDRISRGPEGLARMVRVGACVATGGVADRWDIDCGAAGGAGYGQILMLRLDDGAEFYEPIREGE